MFDPAAMGTLRIGLDAIEADSQTTRRPPPVPGPRRGVSLRVALAQSLRRVAAFLESRTVDEVGA